MFNTILNAIGIADVKKALYKLVSDKYLVTNQNISDGATKTTPDAVDQYLEVNIDGTVHYIPAYTSKTA